MWIRLFLLCALGSPLAYCAWCDATELTRNVDPQAVMLRAEMPSLQAEESLRKSQEAIQDVATLRPALLTALVTLRGELEVKDFAGSLVELARGTEKSVNALHVTRQFIAHFQNPPPGASKYEGEPNFDLAVKIRRLETALRREVEKETGTVKDLLQQYLEFAPEKGEWGFLHKKALCREAKACIDWQEIPREIKDGSTEKIVAIVKTALGQADETARLGATSDAKFVQDAARRHKDFRDKYQDFQQGREPGTKYLDRARREQDRWNWCDKWLTKLQLPEEATAVERIEALGQGLQEATKEYASQADILTQEATQSAVRLAKRILPARQKLEAKIMIDNNDGGFSNPRYFARKDGAISFTSNGKKEMTLGYGEAYQGKQFFDDYLFLEKAELESSLEQHRFKNAKVTKFTFKGEPFEVPAGLKESAVSKEIYQFNASLAKVKESMVHNEDFSTLIENLSSLRNEAEILKKKSVAEMKDVPQKLTAFLDALEKLQPVAKTKKAVP